MIFKNKKLKTAMAMMAILSIFGGSVTSTYANEINENKNIVSFRKSEKYKLNTVLKHETKEEESSANKYLKESYLKVEDSKTYMVMVFSSGNLMKSVIPSINDKEVEYTNILEGETRTITFEISSLKDNIKIDFKINPFDNFVVNATCRVEAQLEEDSNEDNQDKEEDKNDTITGATPEKPSDEENKDNDKEEDKNDNNDNNNSSDKNDNINNETTDKDNNLNNGSSDKNDNVNNSVSDDKNEDTSNNKYKNGYYQIKNIVVLDNEIGYSMVRNILNETSNLEIKNGKYYLTFEMGQSSQMKNIVIKSNSKTLSYTKTNVGNNTIRIKVQIPNLSSKLNISTYILAMGRNVDFDLKLDQSTLKFISSNEEAKLPENNNNNVVNNIVSGDSNVSESINNSNNLVGNNISKKGKLYNIKNEIIHDNETGKAMARKYLNETSKIEEIDGELYLTLTFTGADLMQNHKFYVNGNLVKYEVTSSSSSSKSYRFKINSLSDDIKVNVYIVPMNTTVEFGVKLLENTYTFVKDFEVLDRKLPQTGGLINNETLFINGSLIIALGAFIGRRKRK